MEVTGIFAIVGFTIFLGFIGEYLGEKTSIPDALLLILAGVLVGVLTDTSSSTLLTTVGPIFTTFALVFLLFEGVLYTDLKEIWRGVIGGSNLSVLSFIITLLAVPIVMLFFGWGILEGLLLGAILGDAAQTVVVPLIKRIKIGKQAALVLTFETAITDVLCIVGAMTILNIIVIQSFDLKDVVGSVFFSFSMAIFMGVIAGLLWIELHRLMDSFSKNEMTTIAALLLLFSAVEYFGASGALACLAFGIVVGNQKKVHILHRKENLEYSISTNARHFFSEIAFFVKTFFFFYLGLIINFRNPWLILIGLLLTVVLMLLRPIAVAISMKGKSIDSKDRAHLEILNPKGLSAAILAQLPAQYGLAHGTDFSTIALSVITFSVVFSLVGAFMIDRGYFKGIGNTFLDVYGKIRKPVPAHEAKGQGEEKRGDDEALQEIKE